MEDAESQEEVNQREPESDKAVFFVKGVKRCHNPIFSTEVPAFSAIIGVNFSHKSIQRMRGE